MNPLLVDKLPAPNDARLRRFSQLVADILNALLRDGVLTQDGDSWGLDINEHVNLSNNRLGGGAPALTLPLLPPAWLHGPLPPGPEDGKEGDWWLQTLGGLVWVKESPCLGQPPRWRAILKLPGQGPRGYQGEMGPPGPRGEPGPAQPKTVGAEVKATVNNTIGTGATTVITFDTTSFDDGSFFDGSTKLTFTRAGWAFVSGHAKWAANTTGKRVMDLRFNGSTYRASVSVGPNAGNSDPDLATSLAFYAAAGDYVELTVFQNSGGNLNVTAAQLQALRLP